MKNSWLQDLQIWLLGCSPDLENPVIFTCLLLMLQVIYDLLFSFLHTDQKIISMDKLDFCTHHLPFPCFPGETFCSTIHLLHLAVCFLNRRIPVQEYWKEKKNKCSLAKQGDNIRVSSRIPGSYSMNFPWFSQKYFRFSRIQVPNKYEYKKRHVKHHSNPLTD